MSFSRRTVAGILPCAFGPGEMAALPAWQRCGSTAEHNPIIVENRHYGSSKWRIGSGTRPATDRDMQIKGYASKASINLGESLAFHVSTDPGEEFSIDIYRFGHYGGAGARLMTTSPRIAGKRQVDYDFDDSTGLISCTWASVWTLDLPDDWVSGCYLAVTTVSGWRSYYPFVVRDDRRQADLCVVLPLSLSPPIRPTTCGRKMGGEERASTTAMNLFEQGETRPTPTSYARRARKVSFDRPYASDGKPQGFDTDLASHPAGPRPMLSIESSTVGPERGKAVSSSRRVVLGSAIGSAVGAAALGAATLLPTSRWDSGALARRNLILEENKNPGSERWRIGQDQSKPAYDFDMKIKGFASATSVEVGGSIDFFVTVSGGDDFTIAIYRMGHYGGAGGRLLTISPNLPGHRQANPIMDEDSVSCAWQRSWTLRIPTSWVSGVFLAVFTTGSGWRSYTPFVVRDLRRMADLCVILPFSTYQAYNLWPHDGQRGKSLYYGYDLPVDKHDRLTLHYGKRAHKVSFDRPYGNYGLPNGFDLDAHFIEWAESRGYDAVYSSTLDLHLGLLELSRYKGVVFSGHDEYWSVEMRAAAANAVAKGTSLAFMTANNVYWHVRFESKPGGNSNRVMVCYKEAQDPNARTNRGTGRWRDPQPSPANPEQGLLGVMYNGILNAPVPLVVKNSEHWFWAGTGVKDGDRIANVVGGEVDGYADDAPAPVGVKQTLLSASPYFYAGKNRTMIQNTSLYETRSGAIVFAAGSLTWPKSLGAPVLADPRIQTATANMLDRMVANHQ